MKILFIILIIVIFWLSLKLIFRLGVFYLIMRGSGLGGMLAALLKNHLADGKPTQANNTQQGQTNTHQSNTRQRNTQQREPNAQQRMVKCRKCGLYTPEQQAYNENGNYFCCKEHSE